MDTNEDTLRRLRAFQKSEITEHYVYLKLARKVKSPENHQVLERIAGDELAHYRTWLKYTQKEIRPNMLKVWVYYLISRIAGITFGIKIMERGEGEAQENYENLKEIIPEAATIIHDEHEHENALIAMLDEERLRYISSIVLGLNDALMELTGALAGFTLALQNTRLIALTGLITGIAAALSMGASEYLSTKSEETVRDPLKASLYTGSAYVLTVLILVLPYLVLDNYFICLTFAITIAILIIAFFNYYISVARELPFRKHFLEMAGLSLGVAAFSFIIGSIFRSLLGISI